MVETAVLVEEAVEPDDLPPRPDISHLETEDDTPVDNLFSEKQMRLLADSLYNGWAGPGDGRKFLVMANVGLFFSLHEPPLVPDVLVSLDVEPPADLWVKEHRSYFIWEYGKAPDLVLEIVSNRKGDELKDKLLDYPRAGVGYYVVFDPRLHLKQGTLRIFGRQANGFSEYRETWLPGLGLGVKFWEGEYEGVRETWLRWCDRAGQVVPTGGEMAALAKQHAVEAENAANQERQRAEEERQRAEEAARVAEQERQRAESAEQRLAALEAQLRALGVEPATLM